jgi:ABC-2 type transport system permease protein
MIAMLNKELKELVRSYKLLFVPLVFAILALGQPVAVKMMPYLLKSASNLPKGAVIEIPTPAPGEVIAGIYGQINQLGTLILVLVVMGAIAGERATGVAATVLAKPLRRGAYIAAKAVSYCLLAAISILTAVALGAYYTHVLIGPVDWAGAITSALLYIPIMWMVVAVTLACSALLPSPVAAGGAGLVIVILLEMVPKYLGAFLQSVYPGALAQSAAAAAVGGSYAVARPLTGVLLLVGLVLVGGWLGFRKQEI